LKKTTPPPQVDLNPKDAAPVDFRGQLRNTFTAPSKKEDPQVESNTNDAPVVIDFRAHLKKTPGAPTLVETRTEEPAPVIDFRSVLKKTDNTTVTSNNENTEVHNSQPSSEVSILKKRPAVVPMPLAPLDAKLPPSLVIGNVKRKKKEEGDPSREKKRKSRTKNGTVEKKGGNKGTKKEKKREGNR